MSHRSRREGTRSAWRTAVDERQARALELRRAGHDYDAIAAALGYANRSGAYKAVRRALTEAMRAPAEEVRALECARLDVLWTMVFEAALGGDEKAFQRVTWIMDRRARLLGLDAPRRVERK